MLIPVLVIHYLNFHKSSYIRRHYWANILMFTFVLVGMLMCMKRIYLRIFIACPAKQLRGTAPKLLHKKMSHANIASLDLLKMLGKSKQNLPHGGEKWWFTMVESVKNNRQQIQASYVIIFHGKSIDHSISPRISPNHEKICWRILNNWCFSCSFNRETVIIGTYIILYCLKPKRKSKLYCRRK